MTVRPSTIEDFEEVLAVYADAREFMKETGNPHQWGDTSPKTEVVRADMGSDHSFVILDDAGAIIGVFAFFLGADPTYGRIDGSGWLNDEPYGTIHRIAAKKGAHGIFREALAFCASVASNVRIDTHEDNKVMQHLVKKAGFSYCGIIYLANGDPRLAFHKVTKK